jgi:hypothetical protein
MVPRRQDDLIGLSDEDRGNETPTVNPNGGMTKSMRFILPGKVKVLIPPQARTC